MALQRPSRSRLADPDPWTVVAAARTQRGPLMAAWLTAAVVALLCSVRLWARTIRRRPGTLPS